MEKGKLYANKLWVTLLDYKRIEMKKKNPFLVDIDREMKSPSDDTFYRALFLIISLSNFCSIYLFVFSIMKFEISIPNI